MPLPMTPPSRSSESTLLHREWLSCSLSVTYFVLHYVSIYNATMQAWIPFELWPAQTKVLAAMQTESKLVILKARQLGLSWLSLAYALHVLIFQSPSTVLLFSLKEGEAVELLRRLRQMY